MKIKSKKSIFLSTQIYLISFCIFILILLWISEKIFFENYYRVFQKNNVKKIGEEIKLYNKNDLYDYLENLADSNNICIAVFNDFGDVIQFNSKLPGCEFRNDIIRKKVYDFFNSDKKESYENVNINKNDNGYLYAIKKQNTDIFIYASLKENFHLNKLMYKEIVYVIIIGIILSSVIAIYISNLITKPIRSITKKASNIGKENYNNDFEETNILEIDELNKTLDTVQKELGKVEKYQKDLLANVTHDLKTPLTMIKAYAEKIKDISYKDKIKLDNDIKVIIDEADRLTLLVNDILEMSKITNQDKLAIKEYDLANEINNILKRYDIIKDEEGYTFNVIMPEKVIVKADKNRINQVIYNLINNAINYTGDDKKVTIKVTLKNKKYLVEIIDTGKGIPENEISNIWTKYYKNDKNHQRNVISSGIGLSIVKEILENHKFEYGVKSKVGKGSTFYFNIPSGKIHKNNTNK